MKIVSFNIRYDNEEDGKYSFANRKELILEKIKEESPDIIGFQEILPHVYTWLKEELNDYYIIGHGREIGYGGEHMVLAYKKDNFNLHNINTFWLSPNPDEPGSRYLDQSECPRTCIAATIYSYDDKKLFRILNTHLDHERALARKQGLTQIVNYLKEQDKHQPLPTILMGDFNATPDKRELVSIKEYEKFSDYTESLPISYHGFGEKPNLERLTIFMQQKSSNYIGLISGN
jgi:endonuclease/exonuclease/phosphatase family metal-dependent hydrolase